jgi:hypothetical protein
MTILIDFCALNSNPLKILEEIQDSEDIEFTDFTRPNFEKLQEIGG